MGCRGDQGTVDVQVTQRGHQDPFAVVTPHGRVQVPWEHSFR